MANFLKKTLNDKLTDLILKMAASNERLKISDILEMAESENQKLIDLYSDHLIKLALQRTIKQILRTLEIDDYPNGAIQLDLFGEFWELPKIISVKSNEKDFEYVSILNANWADLESHREIKLANVMNATIKLEKYQRFMAKVKPYMQKNPDITVFKIAESLNKEIKLA